jgi:DNA-binding NtrC family response regulator
VVPRVVVCESCLDPQDPALTRLADDGFEVVHCRNCEDLLQQSISRRPAAVICQVRAQSIQDVGILKLLRRVHPDVPLVLLSTEASLEMQRTVQPLRPTYFAVIPIEEHELSEAVRGALGKAANPQRA